MPWEGGKPTQTAQATSDSRVRAVTSTQHPVLVWFVLRERHGQTLCDCGALGLNWTE